MPALFTRLASRLAPSLRDGDLLARYCLDGDEAAFAVLLHRHGSMVYGVCRRILGHSADADDAFQAVFLVLVKRANALHDRVTVGDFLHGVAVRVALKARTAFARLRKHERHAAEMRNEAVTAGEHESSEWLDRELAALPIRFREPVVMCLIQERPRAEVAAELGIPEGTLASRLDTARKRLAERLARYRVAMVLTGLLVPVPSAVAADTLNRIADATELTIHQLAHEVSTAMFSKTKWGVLAAVGTLTLSLGGLMLATAGTAARPLDESKAELVAKRFAPVPEKKPPGEPVWMKAFRKVYELKNDQYIKRVPPPHIDERKQYLLAHYKKRWDVGEEDTGVQNWLSMGAVFLEDDGTTIGTHAICSTDANDPRRPGVQVKPKFVKLANVVEYVTGLKSPEVVLDPKLRDQDVCMDGDFVIRKDAPLAKLVPDLEKVLRECDVDVKLTLKQEEQDVYVVGGKFGLKPREWRQEDEIDVYADEDVMNKQFSHRMTEPHQFIHTQWDYSKSVATFTRSLGEFLGNRFVFDADLPAVARFNWYVHSRWGNATTAAEKAADRDPEKVLKNVAEQTGLTFKKEKRKVPVLSIRPLK